MLVKIICMADSKKLGRAKFMVLEGKNAKFFFFKKSG